MRTRLTATVLSGLMILGVAACSSDAADDTAPADGIEAPAGDTTGTTGDAGTTGGTATDPALGDPALEPTE